MLPSLVASCSNKESNTNSLSGTNQTISTEPVVAESLTVEEGKEFLEGILYNTIDITNPNEYSFIVTKYNIDDIYAETEFYDTAIYSESNNYYEYSESHFDKDFNLIGNKTVAYFKDNYTYVFQTEMLSYTT